VRSCRRDQGAERDGLGVEFDSLGLIDIRSQRTGRSSVPAVSIVTCRLAAASAAVWCLVRQRHPDTDLIPGAAGASPKAPAATAVPLTTSTIFRTPIWCFSRGGGEGRLCALDGGQDGGAEEGRGEDG